MLLSDKYQIYIFDCDGVILDSNKLKIEAMKNALEAHFSDQNLIDECIEYFRLNFGKSRFHHVSYFLNDILEIEIEKKDTLEKNILSAFSKQCHILYLSADITPGFIDFISRCKGKRYVASGSEEKELRDVLSIRGLDVYFDGIFGSPTPKAKLIEKILKLENMGEAVMFGDAVSDLEAAKINKIDFVFYSPYSNVSEILSELSLKDGFSILRAW
ncbi:HAD family hydrolase [Vibrio diabolicus]|uniref:HAD family hydrolase n=1 Tax=Vibrio diabolicus TaxID=50719 RepID=UPI003752DA5A